MIPAIVAAGVRVIGNLASLAGPQPGRPGGEAPLGSILVAPDVAAEMALGVLLASGIARADGSAARAGTIWVEPIEVARVSTWQLAAVVGRRTLGSVDRKLRGLRRRRADHID